MKTSLLTRMMSHFDPKRHIPPAVFAAIAVVYVVMASRLHSPTSAEAPMLYGCTLIGIAILVFLLAFRKPKQASPLKVLSSARRVHDTDWRRAVYIFGLIAGLIVLVFIFGLYVGIPLFLLGFFRFVSKLSVVSSVLLAVLFYGFTWLIFGWFLSLQVYPGYLAMSGML